MPLYDVPSVKLTETDDVDAQRRSLTCWDQDYAQLSPGSFQGRTVEVDFGPVKLFREQISTKVEQVFAPPPGAVIFSMNSGVGARSAVAGIDLDEQAFCLLSGGRDYHSVTPEASDVLGVELPEETLEGYAIACPSSSGHRPVWRALQVPQVTWWLSSVLDCCTQGRTRPFEGENVAMLADMVVESCRALLCDGALQERPMGRSAARFDLVLRAREQAFRIFPETCEVQELAESLRVSQRLLEESFREVLGMGPASWLRVQRLNRAHRDLRDANSDDTTVAEVATRWGFWHLGRFSGYYRDLFGHTPSATLRCSL